MDLIFVYLHTLGRVAFSKLFGNTSFWGPRIPDYLGPEDFRIIRGSPIQPLDEVPRIIWGSSNSTLVRYSVGHPIGDYASLC